MLYERPKFGYYSPSKECRVNPIRENMLEDLKLSHRIGKVDMKVVPMFRTDLYSSNKQYNKTDTYKAALINNDKNRDIATPKGPNGRKISKSFWQNQKNSHIYDAMQ